jgi:cytochrome c oxidase subunit I+III
MPRRVYTYPTGSGFEDYNLLSTIGAFIFAAGLLLSVVNFIVSLRRGARAPDNPWQGDSLEWSVTSPPPQAQFGRLPVVRDRHPLWDEHWQPETMRPEDTAPKADDREEVDQLDHWPTTWRGALAVSVNEGTPIGLVHLPARSIAPFVMSVGFVALFAALIVDYWPVAFGALAVIAVALVLWFRPQDTETRAIEEVIGGGTGHLPLLVAGPQSNGYWGTAVFILVLATALTTIVASYFYLGGPRSEAATAAPLTLPGAAAVLLIAGAGTSVLTVRSLPRAKRAGVLLWLAGSAVLAAAHLWLLLESVTGLGLAPATDGRDSAFLSVAGFQALVLVILLVMLAVAVVWTLGRPGDPRGHAVIWNSAMVYCFAAVSGAITVAALYLVPRLG